MFARDFPVTNRLFPPGTITIPTLAEISETKILTHMESAAILFLQC
jgi:hypothetical protein